MVNINLGSWKHGGKRVTVKYYDLSYAPPEGKKEYNGVLYQIEICYNQHPLFLMRSSVPLDAIALSYLEQEIHGHERMQANPSHVEETLIALLNDSWQKKETKKK